MRERLTISFSGGRTSAVMTKLCIEKYSDTHDIAVVFANTGCEHPATLDFVRDCTEAFRFNTVWVEGVTGPHGTGMRHKIVTYETASRNGEPFQDYIAKYGIPCQSHPQCTSRLKEEVMDSYRHRELGWKRGTYDTAIGIRADESDRMSIKAKEKRFIYPLVEWGWTKDMVKAECARWPHDLQIPGDHFGNCVWCWKKSFRKLMTIAKQDPSVFDFPKKMEELYKHHKGGDKGYRVFFRGNRSTEELLKMAKKPFEPYSDSKQRTLFEFDDFMDSGSGCGESCEIGADDDNT